MGAETIVGGLIFLLAALLFLSLFLFLIYLAVRSVTLPVYKHVRFSILTDIYPKGFELYARLLENKFHFFRLLNDQEQRKFVSRVRFIRNNKNFVSREVGLTITEEMEILVSAAITQLTFGFSRFELEELTHIHLTATSFYSNLIGRQVKGLTFKSGRVFLSWADFEHGYLVPHDNLNLGLHELAHSLWFVFLENEGLREMMDEWHTEALKELYRVRLGTDSQYLRDYAATNIEEFWACCVECFFESSVEFKNKIPDLYYKTAEMLNQDMAARVSAGRAMAERL